MKKFIAIALSLVLLCGSVLLCLSITASAESLYIRKIVSVVYDDSGSMKGDKAKYANYAMKSFCGMLNSEDQLFITYMNSGKNKTTTEKIDLSSGNIQSSVNNIRDNSYGGTPFGAVEQAYNTLKSVADSNPNTQYWLVVITDGEFDGLSNDSDSLGNSRELDTRFSGYVASKMPNGTNPQLTFLSIGTKASHPTQNQSKGIYVYSAENASGIIKAMSDMADRISGRTRLQKSNISKIDDKTIQVSSAIPLLNIAAFTQGSNAKLVNVSFNDGVSIPISRSVSLSYPNDSDLVGGAFLVGDSKKIIDAGTYNMTFDKEVDIENVIVLFEPALEVKMALMLNNKKVTDYQALDDVMEGDKISVSYQIYEMGTDKVISPSLLPPGTKFEATVFEDGNIASQNSGDDMRLPEYTLNKVNTEVKVAVIIEGFNPIEYSIKFTPTEYTKRHFYTMSAEYGSGVKSVKIDDIANNKDLMICFTVYDDGVAITDPEVVKALKPVISASPAGNRGVTTYSDDGKIVFTPNAADYTSSNVDSFDVNVSCSIEDGTSESKTYTVLMAKYQVIPVNPSSSIKKTEFFNNDVSASFYITKDGVRLDKAAVENGISVSLNEEHSDLKMKVEVAPDGTITVTPYSEEEFFVSGCWIGNGFKYITVSGSDITLTFNHTYGSATAVIDVTEENIWTYVVLPILTFVVSAVILVILLVCYIVALIKKPRYNERAVLYLGQIEYNDGNSQIITSLEKVYLGELNKTGIGILCPKVKKNEVGDKITITIHACPNNTIACESGIQFQGKLLSYYYQEDFKRPENFLTLFDEQDEDASKYIIQLIQPNLENIFNSPTGIVSFSNEDCFLFNCNVENENIKYAQFFIYTIDTN